MLKRLVLFTFIFMANTAFSNEACNRIAVVNYREIPVDAGNNKKGEGLRFYLSKDAKSAALLDEYQTKSAPSKIATGFSTVGSTMILAGLLQTDTTQGGLANKNTLLYGGLIISTLTYMLVKTVQYNNEDILHSAIQQYNKRNLPRIYFSPQTNNNGDLGIAVGVGQEF